MRHGPRPSRPQRLRRDDAPVETRNAAPPPNALRPEWARSAKFGPRPVPRSQRLRWREGCGTHRIPPELGPAARRDVARSASRCQRYSTTPLLIPSLILHFRDKSPRGDWLGWQHTGCHQQDDCIARQAETDFLVASCSDPAARHRPVGNRNRFTASGSVSRGAGGSNARRSDR